MVPTHARAEIHSEFVFAHKPAGVPTHRPSEDRLGFVEWLSEKLEIPLFVCHRLDKETSGAMVFARSSEAAALLSQLFAERKVQKRYLFISDQKSCEIQWEVSEKGKGTPESECPFEGRVDHLAEKRGVRGHTPPDHGEVGGRAVTQFEQLGSVGSFYLYSARPLSGKTHQIRKHAVKSMVPILGDSVYGGRPFPRLMLHSEQLTFSLEKNSFQFVEEPSLLFSKALYLEDSQWAHWVSAIERRFLLFPDSTKETSSFRLIHQESGDLRWDRAGPVDVLGWWNEKPPSPSEQEKIKELMNRFGHQQWNFHWRPGVGSHGQWPELLIQGEDSPTETWTFHENTMKLQGRADQGHNLGLFFDQRDRRQWVRDASRDKKVLNLFSFTCGFSLAAALGGAQKVVSVDLFKRYLEWGKANFELNDLSPGEPHEFRAMDSLDYLRYADRKKLSYDIIVCDPPSFSRNKRQKKVFRIDKDWPVLLDSCQQVLAPGGTLLFSTNFEKWDFERWQGLLQDWARAKGLAVRASESQWDFAWQKKEAHLKAFFLKKACPPSGGAV
ncbi:MAG: class I SAM-dependent methyltransferase [Pseudomonadota bacterium]